jgi:hypothetical protein
MNTKLDFQLVDKKTLNIEGYIRIYDPTTKEIYVDKRG